MPLKKSTRFIFLYGFIAVGAISFTTLFSLAEIRSDALRQAMMLQESHLRTFRILLEEKGKPFSVVSGKLFAGDYLVNGTFELPDRVKEIFGGTATIFMGKVRVSTNVLKEDGSRAINTLLDGPTCQVVLVKGEPYRGETSIFGMPYFAAYDPIRNSKGEVVGALFVGVKKSDFLATYKKIRTDVIAIHCILIGTFILLTYLLLQKRKKAEKVLRQSEEQLKFVLSGSNDALWDLRVKNRELTFNQRWAEILGYQPEEIRKDIEFWQQLVHPDDLQNLLEQYQGNVKNNESRFRVECRLMSRSGEWRWILLRGRSVDWDSQGKPTRITGTATDITERIRADLELRQSHRLLRTVFSSLNEALFLLEEDSRVVIDCNTSAEIMFGYTRAELLGISSDILHVNSEMAETFSRKAASSYQEKSFFAGEYQMKRKGDEVFPTDHFCNPIPGEGDEPFLILYVVRDISERKRAEVDRTLLEEQLQQAQKMEAVGQLAGGIAHDFNNILTAIIGYGHLVLMNMQGPDQSRHHMEQILASSERAAGLTQGLLAFSRKQESNPQPVDLNGIVRNMRKFLERIIGEDIEIKFDMEQDGLTVLADTGQMEQVLMNLVTNARDAMPDGGMLHIKTGLMEDGKSLLNPIDSPQLSRYGYISVTDTGDGMDEKIREKIYEPFFTTKEVGKGTGLGLSIAYGIIKQHNGFISVESQEREGTTFRVHLPLIKQETVTAEIVKPFFLPYGQETILVAEDDEEVRNLGRSLLEECGHTVIIADNGADAVEKFSEHADSISLVILDVVMPKMNGRQALEVIREMQPDVRVLFMSGYTAEIIAAKGVLEGDLDFMEKPMIPKTFLHKVREILDRQA
ncbi:MAG: cache domain-containing protein [Geobacteraceae bacterium]|nr:cache domain-containing protein [Geobacteraceae bacterium]